MKHWFKDNAAAVGGTPLVKLNRLVNGCCATVLAKIESRNPASSVKDRIGVSMVNDAIERGELTDGKEIVEATSGNTGIALAYVAASKGIPLTIVMPDTMSIERRKLLLAYGARLILTPGKGGMPVAIDKANELANSDSKYVMLGQFTNPANVTAHETTTGPELWEQSNEKMDVLISGVGTGGTITGVARYVKNTLGKPLHTVAVEPEDSPVITQTVQGQPLKPGPHKIQGLGAGFVPEIMDLSLVDDVALVSNEESVDFARRLASEEGILAGISSGAAAAVAIRYAKNPAFKDKTIVVVLPDSGERYLSSILFEDLFNEQGYQL